jgi:hypothetical protein
MSAPAYRINDRRSSSGYIGNNRLIEAAAPTADRKWIPRNDRDFHRNITTLGRKNLTDLGRWLFWNVPAVRGMAMEQADLAVGTFIPQFFGANKAWGSLAEDWLFNWHKIGDIAGPPFDYDFLLQSLVMLPFIDGDFGLLLTGTAGTGEGAGPVDYPMWQIIPGHRIGRWSAVEETVQGGPYDGYRVIDGVIVNEYGRAMAYRVFGESLDPNEFTDISANDMALVFVPLWPGQLRGLSGVATSAFNFQDAAEWDRFEMLAHKVFSSQTIVETNETGDTDAAKALIKTPKTFDDDGNKLTLDEQTFGGGTVRYFKAGTGSKLESFMYDRPSTATQEFQERKVRDAFKGTEWDAFFSLDPQSVGGAPMRVIVEKINRTLQKLRRRAAKVCARLDGYAISKAIKNGELTFDADWWKFEHQGPGDITADAMYDSQVGLQETAQGFSTRKIQAAKRGEYWEELDAQREAEADSDLERAGRLAKKHGITIQDAMTVLRPPTPNGMPSAAAQKEPPQDNASA